MQQELVTAGGKVEIPRYSTNSETGTRDQYQGTDVLLQNLPALVAKAKELELLLPPLPEKYSNGIVLWKADANLAKDDAATAFLPDVVKAIDCLCVKTIGDGNCLLYSVSQALCGNSDLATELRVRGTIELASHLQEYQAHDKGRAEEDWSRNLKRLCTDKMSVELAGIQALSNVLRRPILLYTKMTAMQAQDPARGTSYLTRVRPLYHFALILKYAVVFQL